MSGSKAERAKDPAPFNQWLELLRPALDQQSIPDMIAAVDHLLLRNDLDARSVAVSSSPKPSSWTVRTRFTPQVDLEVSPGTGPASAAVAGAASAGAAIVVIYEAFFG
jgi:hypothetical protein